MPKIRVITPVFKHQADAALSQANPVSGTLYTVLDTTQNVRLYMVQANITWAVTQPTPLDIVVTIDGQSLVFRRVNPVSGVGYEGALDPTSGTEAMKNVSDDIGNRRAFLLEGRSVKVEVRVTWAVTQPTPLDCRVKYAKL